MNSIRLILQPHEKIILPFAHMEMLQGLFYKLLSYDNEFSTLIHDSSTENRSAYKLFCFSDIAGKYDIRDKRLEFSGALKWEIRSIDDRVISTIIRNIFNRREFTLNGCPFTITDIEFPSFQPEDEEIAFRMKTPAVAYLTNEDRKTVYFSPNENEFFEICKQNLRNKYYIAFGIEYDGELWLECDYCPPKYKVVTKYKSTYINAWFGSFTLRAEPAMLSIAYYCGVGSKNSMGFGMIDTD